MYFIRSSIRRCGICRVRRDKTSRVMVFPFAAAHDDQRDTDHSRGKEHALEEMEWFGQVVQQAE
jgi:hypothetical protein